MCVLLSLAQTGGMSRNSARRLERLGLWAGWGALATALALQLPGFFVGWWKIYCFRALAGPCIVAFSVAAVAVVVSAGAVLAAIALDWKWERKLSERNLLTVVALVFFGVLAPTTLNAVFSHISLSSHPSCDDPAGVIGAVSPELWRKLQTPWDSPEYLEHRNIRQLDADHAVPPEIFR
jgi:hypothetical protein